MRLVKLVWIPAQVPLCCLKTDQNAVSDARFSTALT